jgi:hypothetical protein
MEDDDRKVIGHATAPSVPHPTRPGEHLVEVALTGDGLRLLAERFGAAELLDKVAPAGPLALQHQEPDAEARAMHEALRRLTDGVRTTELQAVEAACQRLLVVLGLEGLRTRVERRSRDRGSDAGLLAGPVHEIAVDGAVVWRGEWVSEREHHARWQTRWLIDPERLAR